MKRLLVIIPDRITEILAKGEYQPSYYNPGELFDEVHILQMNDERPPLDAVQHTVGRAKLVLHNHPDDLTLVPRHNRWLTPFRLRRWAQGGVEIARRIEPQLIRCHGVDWNTYLASRINAALGIPYVVSLHINPDVNPVRRLVKSDLSPEERRQNGFYEYLESQGLRRAALVMPVYKPILPYLQRRGVRRVEVCYNILDERNLRAKQGYSLHEPPRLLYVGRLFAEKNPAPIIRAVASIPGLRYTIVGDGPLRPTLEALVRELGVEDRIDFRPAVPNADLCRTIADYDLFVIHTEYFEISKSVLEALLTGIPTIMNRRTGDPVPELEDGSVRFVEPTVEGYRTAITSLLEDDAAREALGRKAYALALEKYAPVAAERKVVEIYRRLALPST